MWRGAPESSYGVMELWSDGERSAVMELWS